MPQHIDYDKENEYRVWWLNNTGGTVADGLTVRDYFAAKAVQILNPSNGADYNAAVAYDIADAMMKERAK